MSFKREKQFLTLLRVVIFLGVPIKSFLIAITLSFVFVSCSHLHKVNSTNKKNIIEVQFTDSDHVPEIGQSVNVYNWVLKVSHTSSKSDVQKGWIKQNEVQGKIIEVLPNKLIKVELEDDFEVTEKTRAELY